jgi:DNA-binding response OmpR family regulator
MNTILVIDDDSYIRELVGTVLRNEGFETIEAHDGRDGLTKLGNEKIDLCIVDVMMPKVDGFEFCKSARKYYTELPILMLTAKSDVSQKVRGLGLGADDYLTKPFENAELIARVREFLRRYQIVSSKIVRIGDLTLDRNSYTIKTGEDSQFEIPMKEFELLFLLGSEQGKTLTRDKLIEEVWGYDFDGNERTLDVHIGRIREKLSPDTYHFRIVTVRGLGYRLEAVN